jgi:hypothetical protein
MREVVTERRLIRLVERLGGCCWKLSSPGRRGVPDRLILLPDGVCLFAEVKSPNGRLSPLQRQCHKELKELGFEVLVIR